MTDGLIDQSEPLLSNEPSVALATLVSATGSSSKKIGTKMFVGESGRLIGGVTIGGCVDAQVDRSRGRAARARRPARAVDLARRRRSVGDRADLRRHRRRADRTRQRARSSIRAHVAARARLRAERAPSSPRRSMATSRRSSQRGRGAPRNARRHGPRRRGTAIATDACGGSRMAPIEMAADAPVFFDRLSPPTTLLIVGAGQIAMSLTRMARELDMRTIVVDGRERYATRERFPDADEFASGCRRRSLRRSRRRKRVAVVLVAHDYKYELPVLRALLRDRTSATSACSEAEKRGDAVRAAAPRGRLHRRRAGAHPHADRSRHRRQESTRGRGVDPRRARGRAQREACVTAFRAIVLEHFRHPRNRGPLDERNGVGRGSESAVRRSHSRAGACGWRSDRRRALHGRRVRDLHRVGVGVD